MLVMTPITIAESGHDSTHSTESAIADDGIDEAQCHGSAVLSVAVAATVDVSAPTRFLDKHLEASCNMLRKIAVFGGLDVSMIAAIVKSSKRSMYSAGEYSCMFCCQTMSTDRVGLAAYLQAHCASLLTGLRFMQVPKSSRRARTAPACT